METTAASHIEPRQPKLIYGVAADFSFTWIASPLNDNLKMNMEFIQHVSHVAPDGYDNGRGNIESSVTQDASTA